MLPIEVWQKRLSDNFSHNEVVGGSLLGLMEMEHAAGVAFVEKFVGHRHLSDASQSFFLTTLRLVDESELSEFSRKFKDFPLIFIEIIMVFRRIRAASSLSLSGYFGSAYALLRDVKDRTIHLSAVFQGIITYSELMGISTDDPVKGTVAELKNIRRRNRIFIEKYINEIFIGKKSDLSSIDVYKLSLWSELFDREIHGSYLSSVSGGLDWLLGKKPLSLVSLDDENMAALYMNRFCEVSWMYLRLLPFLQVSESGFGDEWERKWTILDESFWQMEMGLAKLGKPIANAFLHFIDMKFPFEPKSRLIGHAEL